MQKALIKVLSTRFNLPPSFKMNLKEGSFPEVTEEQAKILTWSVGEDAHRELVESDQGIADLDEFLCENLMGEWEI